MNSELLYYIRRYKKLINEEPYEHIINEMLHDLKETLLFKSNDIDINYQIVETFHSIKTSDNVIDELTNLENILAEGSGISISNIKASFNNKHNKIIQRDKKWLNSNKKKILGMNFEGVELEVLSDYKVTFEQLLNRHNIFDKIFVNSDNNENLGDKLRRFEDKNENLKNGLDNYFRTGTSRREIGLRKVSGDEARMAVENMVAYCESFLAGKQFLEEKMNNIIVSISDAAVKESLSPIETLKILLEDNNVKDILNTSKELSSISKSKSSQNTEPVENNKKENKEEKIPDKNKEKPVDEEPEDIEEEPVDDENIDEDIDDEENKEETSSSPERGIQDRQVGIAVLLTVAEERYFDYIGILKGLLEE